MPQSNVVERPKGEISRNRRPRTGATGRPARIPRGLSGALCVLFAAVVTLAVLQFSFRHGRLIAMPYYDDVGYFADGLKRLQSFYDWGVAGLVHTYKMNPSHSPFESAMAMSAFALFGVHEWAPYALNSLLALAYFLMADRLLRGVGLVQKIICFVFLATIPFVGMSVHEFRPDHAVALFTSIGIFLLFTRSFIYGPSRRRFAAGAWLGLAMLTKPPVFPQTVLLGCTAIVLATLCDWAASEHRPRGRAVVKAWAQVLLPFVLIPLPHYVYNRVNILTYIHNILFGAFKDTYQLRATVGEHARFFLTGPGGKVMLGGHVWILLTLLVAGTTAVMLLGGRRDRARVTAMLMLLLGAWLIPTINKTKQEFFGLGFDTLLTFTVFFILGRLMVAERFKPRLKVHAVTVAVGIALLFGAWNFQWPTRSGNLYAGWQIQRRQITESIFNTLISHCNFHHADERPLADPNVPDEQTSDASSPVVLFCGTGEINNDVMEFMAYARQSPIQVIFPASVTSVEEFAQLFGKADFIFCGQSGTHMIADFMPGSKLQDSLLVAVRDRPEFMEIGQWSFMKAKGRSMFLFMRRPDYAGFTPVSGLGELEGPFPEAGISTVRWGYGPKTVLKVHASRDGNYELYWYARADFLNETVTINLDGKEVAQRPVLASYTKFSEGRVPLTLTAGDHELELIYPKYHTEPGVRPMAVLFQRLQVTRKEDVKQ